MKKILVVVDMQNDFITGSLGTPEAQAIVPNVKKKIEEYVKNGNPVIFTRDTHYRNYLDTREGKNLPVEHCIIGTHGWNISDELYPLLNEDVVVFDKPEFVTIEASQTAFLIPLVGDTGEQAAFDSEELLLEHKVATKEIQIPHRWVQTGKLVGMGEYRASAKLIVVERKPVSRSWESGDSAATSANRAIFGETSDGIGIYVGMNCSAQIEEKDAAKFLYRYNNTPLETVIDTDIKKMVEDAFNMQVSKYASTDLLNHKAEIMEEVKTSVTTFFKEYGVTITVLGLKEGISYENPNIQLAIDEKFASEQKLEIQLNENLANIAKAEAEAEAMLKLAEAEAKANELLTESLTDEILAQMYYEKWDGKLPYFYGSDDENTIIQLPTNGG